jgi:hypothetical protein
LKIPRNPDEPGFCFTPTGHGACARNCGSNADRLKCPGQHDNCGPQTLFYRARRYFRELAEEVLTRKMNWYNGISVDLKMVFDTMTEHYERRHEKWLLFLLLMKVNV